jgi:hypothetical protein
MISAGIEIPALPCGERRNSQNGGSAARVRSDVRGLFQSSGLALVIILLTSGVSGSGVLTEGYFKKVESIKPLFQNLMGDLVQSSKRTDIAGGDADCIKATIHELMQISEELQSYEYLITIEKDMTDLGKDSPMRGIVKFAVDQSNSILAGERKRLSQLSDQCARFPLSYGKTQQALQFINTTTDILNSIQLRL